MKKTTMFAIAALAAAFAALAATVTAPVGESLGAFPNGARLMGAALVSTNATATATVEAVYDLGDKAVTNALVTLTASGGFAETNGMSRAVLPGAALRVTGEKVTLYVE